MSAYVNLPDDVCDEVTRLTLMETLGIIEDEIRALEAARTTNGSLPEYQNENLKDVKKTRKAIRRALAYFLTPTQWDDFNA